MDDHEMVRLALADDRRAYELLGKRIDSELRRFFARFPDPELAAELAQQTALALLEKFKSREKLPQDSVSGWIRGFAGTQVKQWFTWLTREQRRAQLREDYARVMPIRPALDEKWYANDERLRMLMEIVAALPDKILEAYEAHLCGYRYTEIAEMFEVSEATARNRVAVARRRVPERWALQRVTPTPYRTTEKAS